MRDQGFCLKEGGSGSDLVRLGLEDFSWSCFQSKPVGFFCFGLVLVFLAIKSAGPRLYVFGVAGGRLMALWCEGPLNLSLELLLHMFSCFSHPPHSSLRNNLLATPHPTPCLSQARLPIDLYSPTSLCPLSYNEPHLTASITSACKSWYSASEYLTLVEAHLSFFHQGTLRLFIKTL